MQPLEIKKIVEDNNIAAFRFDFEAVYADLRYLECSEIVSPDGDLIESNDDILELTDFLDNMICCQPSFLQDYGDLNSGNAHNENGTIKITVAKDAFSEINLNRDYFPETENFFAYMFKVENINSEKTFEEKISHTIEFRINEADALLLEKKVTLMDYTQDEWYDRWEIKYNDCILTENEINRIKELCKDMVEVANATQFQGSDDMEWEGETHLELLLGDPHIHLGVFCFDGDWVIRFDATKVYYRTV